jgi:hypothetical protein
VKTVEIKAGSITLRDAVRALGGAPYAVTDNGRPVAVLLPVTDVDLETIALSLNPKFCALLVKSAERQTRDGGLTDAEVRRALGMEPANGKSRVAAQRTTALKPRRRRTGQRKK